jgi:Xaa-Pro dipeptidase
MLKRSSALEAAAATGLETVVARTPATVRWLLCGRGRPVSITSPAAGYTVVLSGERSYALYPDIETSRVAAEERLEELGYEPVPFAWHEGPSATLERILDGRPALEGDELDAAVAPERRALGEAERDRYRAAGADAASAMKDCLDRLSPSLSEVEAAAELDYRARLCGFVAPVVLVAGQERQKVHRHPLPTEAPLGCHALLAFTAEREGLHVSLTRLISFGPVSAVLRGLVDAVARVDAAMLRASRPGRSLGDVFEVASSAYEAEGFPGEWRKHHQGGLTGYDGREVFGTPNEPTRLPHSCAVAWNPSITGGAKSEDTVLVTENGLDVVTRTPDLPEIDVGGLPRPGVLEL